MDNVYKLTLYDASGVLEYVELRSKNGIIDYIQDYENGKGRGLPLFLEIRQIVESLWITNIICSQDMTSSHVTVTKKLNHIYYLKKDGNIWNYHEQDPLQISN